MNLSRSTLLQHPERIHSALWRGSQLAQSSRPTLSTGFAHLDRQLPGQGWPLGAAIELTLAQYGIGEISLLRPALARVETGRSIVLVQPPHTPFFQCWAGWQLLNHPLLWVNPPCPADALWACEQILKHNTSAALLVWVNSIRPEAVRRLHRVAQQSDTLFVLMRPQAALQQASAAPLRLSLIPAEYGLELSIIKRQGPACSQPLSIALHRPRLPFKLQAYHAASLDQPLSAFSQPGRPVSPVVQSQSGWSRAATRTHS